MIGVDGITEQNIVTRSAMKYVSPHFGWCIGGRTANQHGLELVCRIDDVGLTKRGVGHLVQVVYDQSGRS